jgi:hypothetical protein
VSQLIRRPIAWAPIALSLAILVMVVTTLSVSGSDALRPGGLRSGVLLPVVSTS